MFSKSSENHQGRDTSIWGEATCSQNSKDSTYVSIGVELGSLLVGITHDWFHEAKCYWPYFLM